MVFGFSFQNVEKKDCSSYVGGDAFSIMEFLGM